VKVDWSRKQGSSLSGNGEFSRDEEKNNSMSSGDGNIIEVGLETEAQLKVV
jgi:hypothetical protein